MVRLGEGKGKSAMDGKDTSWEGAEADDFRVEAAAQFGFRVTDDSPVEFKDWKYTGSEAQLVAFARACERAGLQQSLALSTSEAIQKRIDAIDALNNPILDAERQRVLEEVRINCAEPKKD